MPSEVTGDDIRTVCGWLTNHIGGTWRPIETADKDASSLMLGIFRQGVLSEIHIGGYCYAIDDDEVSCWWSDQADDEICPTHWLPLPGPSAPASPEQGEVVRELVEAMGPFSDMAGEMFARGWDESNIALALDNPDDPHRVTAGDFFRVRRALAKIGANHAK